MYILPKAYYLVVCEVEVSLGFVVHDADPPGALSPKLLLGPVHDLQALH